MNEQDLNCIRYLKKVLVHWENEKVMEIFQEVMKHPPELRVPTVLKLYYKEIDQIVVRKRVLKDAKLLQNLLPKYSLKYFTTELEVLGNNHNRVEILLRQLSKKDLAVVADASQADEGFSIAQDLNESTLEDERWVDEMTSMDLVQTNHVDGFEGTYFTPERCSNKVARAAETLTKDDMLVRPTRPPPDLGRLWGAYANMMPQMMVDPTLERCVKENTERPPRLNHGHSMGAEMTERPVRGIKPPCGAVGDMEPPNYFEWRQDPAMAFQANVYHPQGFLFNPTQRLQAQYMPHMPSPKMPNIPRPMFPKLETPTPTPTPVPEPVAIPDMIIPKMEFPVPMEFPVILPNSTVEDVRVKVEMDLETHASQLSAGLVGEDKLEEARSTVVSVKREGKAQEIKIKKKRKVGEANCCSSIVATAVDERQRAKLLHRMMEIFPEACPVYLRDLCKDKEHKPEIFDELINVLLSEGGYPKRRPKEPSPELELDSEEQYEMLKQILPDADPSYLRMKCDHIKNANELKEFTAQAIETRKYPTMKDYLRKQQISAQMKQYTTEFSVEKFLEVIPDPVKYFNNPARPSIGKRNEQPYCEHYVSTFLKNQFPHLDVRTIVASFNYKARSNLTRACKVLSEIDSAAWMKKRRKPTPMPEPVQNIPLLQEIAYITHRDEIRQYLTDRIQHNALEQLEAKANGLLVTCCCCYDDEVMGKDTAKCSLKCVFCQSCVRRSVEIAFADGKLDYPCLAHCTGHFNLQTLQSVLKPRLFSKLAQRKQLEEVKAAGIEDLESCPFCDFATIPAQEDKLFCCLNPECMKESCRLCKEPSHIPLHCDEIEKDDDVKRRTYIENKMTEALLRKCYKCGLKFIKLDGCNKMTCSCGAVMCYLCRKPVANYKHFNGDGGDRLDLCPLYSDTNKFHEEQVLQGAKEAKQELGEEAASLKIDPTLDVAQHYAERARRLPQHTMNNMRRIDQVMAQGGYVLFEA